MICQACRNEITREEWIKVKVTCMVGPPHAAREVPYPDAPSSCWGVCLDCVPLLEVCMQYLTDPNERAKYSEVD